MNYSIRGGSSDGIKVNFTGGTQEIESDITENQHVFFDVPNSHPGGAFSRTIDATVTCP
ncbi:hypothetical protein [Enterobacter cloacae]|uniref:hypothetical protein n=1 Tax=Enterobacter cloacae TaxID=550 RepID=UPI0015F7D0E4|nr:hypothetical protein [Enterobacter cloacae]